MQRQMTSDLDDAMALRDAGEVQELVDQQRTRVLRTPGLRPVFAPNEIALTSDEDHLQKPTDLAGLLDVAQVDVPILGKVNLVHVAVAVGVTLLVCKMLKK